MYEPTDADESGRYDGQLNGLLKRRVVFALSALRDGWGPERGTADCGLADEGNWGVALMLENRAT